MINNQTFTKLTLVTIYYLDQLPRKLLFKVNNSLVRRFIWYFIKSCDCFNGVLLILIRANFEWADENVYGETANKAIFNLVMHSNLQVIEDNVRPLHNSVLRNGSPRKHLAQMIDRLLMYRGKRQVYGTQIRCLKLNDTNSCCFIYPIVNIQTVNVKRVKMGLEETIEEYALRNNAILYYNDEILKKLQQLTSN